jgi:tetraacyldisaccharide 4'-kinase
MTRFKALIERFRCRIETIARGQRSTPFFSIEAVLLVLSIGYGGLMRLRARLYEQGVLASRTLPCRVVSIGNLISGGTGKTPMTIMVARMIRDLGYRVVVISRGYRGRLEDTGGIVSDGKTLFRGPEDAGDEPCLMARVLKGVPVVVGKRRFKAGMMAVERFKPDVIVLDDAFQHLRLKRDLNLVLLDSRLPYGNGYLLPRGILRESPLALRRAHAVIYTRSRQAGAPSRPVTLPEPRPVFSVRHTPQIRNVGAQSGAFLSGSRDVSGLKGKNALAFAGLADNGQFFESLATIGCTLVHTFSFADHHRYGPGDLDEIARSAQVYQAEVVVTSLKDYVKIENHTSWPMALVVVDVDLQLLGAEKPFLDFLYAALLTPDA